MIQAYLARDKRTLLKTLKNPRKNIVKMGDGQYLHIGLKKCLDHFMEKNIFNTNRIEIDINIDGVPIATNTSCSLWPILINVVGYEFVLMCGSYYGAGKPKCINEYLKQFVDDFLNLKQAGYEYYGKIFDVDIRCIIADAPARAFLLNIPTFSGYFSCHKCCIKGLYLLHRMTFPNIHNTVRTNADFKSKKFAKHHLDNRNIVIEKLPIDCVSSIPIDYMHAVLLGVMHQLLYLWIITRRKPYSIKKSKVKILSNYIISNGNQLPTEFSRKSRGLRLMRRYKATELRQLLLYTLPMILSQILKSKYYDHFIKLHIAIRILCSNAHCITHNNIAKKLLIEFVEEFPMLYEPHCMSFNLHSLLHLCDDVLNYKCPLDSYSAFKFENFLQFLKKLPKCGFNVLEQLNNRIHERILHNQSLTFDRSRRSHSYKKDKSYNYIWINNYKFKPNAPDNFFYCPIEKRVFKICKIFDLNNKVAFRCKKVKSLESVYVNNLIDSTTLGLFKCAKVKYNKSQIKLNSQDFIKVAHFTNNDSDFFVSLIH